MLLAAQQVAADVGPHGHPMSEATSPLADRNRRDGWHYVAKVRVDHAARALAAAQKARSDAYPDADLSSDVWTVEKVYD